MKNYFFKLENKTFSINQNELDLAKKSYLTHNTKLILESYDGVEIIEKSQKIFKCNKCNIQLIEHYLYPYLYFTEDNNILYLSCNEIIIKNLIE